MTVNRTTLLDLPLPVTGTESGTWGDTTNNGLSQYMDIAIAGMNSLTSANFTAGALTIANTLGDSSATNIAAGSAQYATIKVSSLAVNSTITAPSSNRSYRIINADATYSLTIKASGQTGVTFLPGQTGVVAFNGTDYVIVGVVGAGSTTDNTVPRFDGTTGEILQSSGVTIDDSNNVSGVAQLNITTLDATNIEVTNIKAKDGTAAASIADSTGVITVTAAPVMSALTASQAVFTTAGKALTSNAITGTGNVVMSASPTLTGTISAAAATLSSDLTLNGGTANGVLYLNGSKVATSGSALTFDGTTFTTFTSAGTSSPLLVLKNNSAANSSNIVEQQFYASNSFTGNDVIAKFGALNPSAGANNYGAFYWSLANLGAPSEAMRLTSTGLGIGTTSPGAKLDVRSGATTFGAQISTSGTNTYTPTASTSLAAANLQILGGNASGACTGMRISQSASFELFFGAVQEAGGAGAFVWQGYSGSAYAERMRLDSSGNLGLGVTPSAWSGTYKVLEIGNAGNFIAGRSGTAESNFGTNAYFNAGWKYGTTAAAALYQQDSNQHKWFNAPSGTAGNAITFTQAMTLDASGNLGIGTTSPSTRLHVKSSGGVGTSSTFETDASSSSINFVNTGSTTNAYLGSTGTALFFATNNAERARITSGGDLLVGNTGGTVRLTVSASNPANGYVASISNSYATSGRTGTYMLFDAASLADWKIGIPSDVNAFIFYDVLASAERARITSGGDLQISSGGSFQVGGTAARATTAGTNRIDIFNGTAPVGTLTNGISLYSSSGEAYVMDAAGNATLFSPHDAETNEWVFKSKHTPTGKVLKIDVEKLLRFVNDHFGLDAVHEFIES